jgi:hypothetical protein
VSDIDPGAVIFGDFADYAPPPVALGPMSFVQVSEEAPVVVDLHDVRFYGGTRAGIDAQCADCDPIWLGHADDGCTLADLGRFVAEHSRTAEKPVPE